jgi:hypothetical protein
MAATAFPEKLKRYICVEWNKNNESKNKERVVEVRKEWKNKNMKGPK